MNRKEFNLLIENWRRLIESVEEDVYVYTAVTPESEDNIMSKGLLNAVTLIKDPKAVAMARPDPDERKKFIKNVKAGSNEDHYNGTSVFFTEPDWSKITDEHFIKKWNLVTYKINLSRFLRDYPSSWVKGVELLPVISKWNDLSDEDYDRKLEELGYDLSKGWDETRRRKLSLEEIRAFGEKSPEEMWKWYDIDEHAGKYYAANVPHGFIMSEIGRIPPEYIEKNKESLDGTYWGEESGKKITLKDVLDYFDDNEIKPVTMKTEEIFYKFSRGKEVLHIVEMGGKESEERVEKASLAYPITVVKRDGDIEYVLDGNHRLQKAKDIGEEFIKVYVLDLDDSLTPDIFKNMF